MKEYDWRLSSQPLQMQINATVRPNDFVFWWKCKTTGCVMAASWLHWNWSTPSNFATKCWLNGPIHILCEWANGSGQVTRNCRVAFLLLMSAVLWFAGIHFQLNALVRNLCPRHSTRSIYSETMSAWNSLAKCALANENTLNATWKWFINRFRFPFGRTKAAPNTHH